jgi:hypothetical protein
MRAAFEVYRRHRFAVLFASLLATLAAQPVLRALTFAWSPLEFFLGINLFAAAIGAAHQRQRDLLVLAVMFVALRLLQSAVGIGALLPLSKLVWVLACVMALVATVRNVMRPGIVDNERIFAALDAYLLAAFVFGVSYWIMEQAWPGSFGTSSGDPFTQFKAIYFSFVTIATLGYGDVVPKSDPACGLAVVEAVSGQMYLAVLVARLVSLYGRREQGSA